MKNFLGQDEINAIQLPFRNNEEKTTTPASKGRPLADPCEMLAKLRVEREKYYYSGRPDVERLATMDAKIRALAEDCDRLKKARATATVTINPKNISVKLGPVRTNLPLPSALPARANVPTTTCVNDIVKQIVENQRVLQGLDLSDVERAAVEHEIVELSSVLKGAGMNIASSLARSRFRSHPFAGLRSARLGDATVDQINYYLSIADPLLLSICQAEGASGANCASLQAKKSACTVKLDNAIAAIEQAASSGAPGDIAVAGIVSADALLCMKSFYESAKAAFEALPPPPPPPPPGGGPPPTSTGIPTLVWVIGGVVLVGGAGTAIYFATRRK